MTRMCFVSTLRVLWKTQYLVRRTLEFHVPRWLLLRGSTIVWSLNFLKSLLTRNYGPTTDWEGLFNSRNCSINFFLTFSWKSTFRVESRWTSGALESKDGRAQRSKLIALSQLLLPGTFCNFAQQCSLISTEP